MLRLTKKSGYWRSAFLRSARSKPVVLHESRECLLNSAGAKVATQVPQPIAQKMVRNGLARLCRRCGGMK